MIKISVNSHSRTYLKATARARIGATSPLVPLQRKTSLIFSDSQENLISELGWWIQTNTTRSFPRNDSNEVSSKLIPRAQ